MNEKNQKAKKGMSMKGQRTLAYVVLIILTFFCLFWFYIMFINATRSKGELKADQTVSYSQVLRWFRAAICGKTGRI